jgi:HPt (histidine-containing phosphotransfer) domain-containing protein
MGEETLRNNFTFHEKVDAAFLFSMYGDDFSCMEEIFATTLNHIDPDVDAIKQAFLADSPSDLKKAVHKIKPTFGFVGLTEVQHLCKEMEDKCLHINSTGQVKEDYERLITAMENARKIIETEHNKLKDYNSNSI